MKVYKITIYATTIIFLILAIISVCLNFKNDTIWISFLLNWCVGIACSAIVVTLSALIQFKVEQKNYLNAFASNVRSLLFYNEIYGDIFKDDTDISDMTYRQIKEFENLWYKSINESLLEIKTICSNIEFLFENDKLGPIIKQSAMIKIAITKPETLKQSYSQSQSYIYSLAKETLRLNFNDDIHKDIVERIGKF